MSKGISYDTIRNLSVFHPGGLTSGSYVVTPKLPPSYTIVPLSDWGSFTSAALPTGSLVHIHATGTYDDALGYVIGASTNPDNECTLIAVVPKIKYPDIHYIMEDQHHVIHPLRKCTKIESPSNHPQLFNPNCLFIQGPKDKTPSLSDVHTVVYDNSFHLFFKTRFLSIYTDGVEHRLNLDNFSF